MKKSYSSKAFTLIELMVSIFITITIIASFYKLYNASVKTERAASIRVAVNLMGEQMIDTIAESVRLIGLNSSEVDFIGDSTAGLSQNIILSAKENELVFFSPFGSPITKVKEVDGDLATKCSFTLFNSAAFHNGVTKLYFHNQDGVFKTSTMSVSATSGDDVTVEATFASGSGSCKDMFPNGSLVTGEDFKYTLQYGASGNDNELKLSCEKEVSGVWTSDPNCSLIDFSYSEDNAATNFYSMPKFILEYLIEDCVREPSGSLTCTTKWESSSEGFDSAKIRDIIAVRFGFVLLSRKERIYAGNDSDSTLPKYCIFEDVIEGNSELYCYQLPSLNYTASVFRRIIFLSNYRFFVDQNRPV